MYVYQTKFNLTGSVTDKDAAIKYLQLYDMSAYLKNDIDGLSEANRESMDLYSSDIISIVWDLKGDDHGDITLKTRNELSSQALDYISQWVQGQNSDGIGEGFEQQSFAEIYDEDEDGYPDPDSYYMVSFDWHTNPYVFKLINKTNESVQNKQELVDFKRLDGLAGKRTPYAVRRRTSHSGRAYGVTESDSDIELKRELINRAKCSFKSVKWDSLYDSESQLIDDMMKTNSAPNLPPYKLVRGYDYINSFKRVIDSGNTLSPAQMRQLKRLACDIFINVHGL